jgi:two-component system nitrogen regulation sensor histidine kinase NtrY
VVFEPTLGQVVAHAGLTTTLVLDPLPAWAMELATNGDVAVMPGERRKAASVPWWRWIPDPG